MKAPHATPDIGAASVVAGAAPAILTISYGAPLLSAVALKPIANLLVPLSFVLRQREFGQRPAMA